MFDFLGIKKKSNKVKILVIDDEPNIVQTLQDRLEMNEYDVVTGGNGKEGLKLAKSKSMINSVNADDEKLNTIMPLVKKYNTMVIGLTMDKKGIPRDRNERMEHAAKIITFSEQGGIDPKDVYIDPVVLPLNVAQQQAVEVLESIKDFRALCDPPPKTVVGLSNISQGTKKRSLINTTFLLMAMAGGLSAAILDPLDKQLMDSMITGDLMLNKNIYCDSLLQAYRRKR